MVEKKKKKKISNTALINTNTWPWLKISGSDERGKEKMLRRRKSQLKLICFSLEPKLCSKPDDAMEATMRQKYVWALEN